MADAYTHFELESLPSGGWGYLHFPLTMRYARTLGLDCLGKTGKFHTSWGDFHSFKNAEALQYECFRMLALGAKCSIGDQLHPVGKIDPHVYDLVGSVYRRGGEKGAVVPGGQAGDRDRRLHAGRILRRGDRRAAAGADGHHAHAGRERAPVRHR